MELFISNNRIFSFVKPTLSLFAFVLFCGNAYAVNTGGQVLTLNLKGTGIAYEMEVPMIEDTGTTIATCFDVDLHDLSTGLQVGTATDCLADLVDEGGGTKLVATTFFNFVGGSQLVSRGKTTVMPVLHGSPGFTHITGAGADEATNNILSGTKQYAKATGSVRLSGLVNLSKLNSDGEITFDCIFVVKLH